MSTDWYYMEMCVCVLGCPVCVDSMIELLPSQRCYQRGYGSHRVCVCVCVCDLLSTLATATFLCILKRLKTFLAVGKSGLLLIEFFLVFF